MTTALVRMNRVIRPMRVRPTTRARRYRLPLVAGAALVAALAILATPSAGGAGVAEAAGISPVTATPIKHVVYIIQENHSFDNILGYWCVQTGRCDGATSGKIASGRTLPLTKASDLVAGVNHTGDDQLTAIDGGKMDAFNHIGGCAANAKYQCYSQYRPAQIPDIIALANAFTVADRTFEDGPAPSWGMHFNSVTANMDGFVGKTQPVIGTEGILGPGWGCDSGDDAPWISPSGVQSLVPSCVPDYKLNPQLYPYGGAYRATPVEHIPTIMDELDAAGLSWRIYGGVGESQDHGGYTWTICPEFADCIDTQQATNLVSNTKVIGDAQAGTLPSVSIVTPSQEDSQHNGDSMAVGDNWLAKVIGAIEHGPDWSSTAIFLTWDDCGCFYDHVVPPAGESVRVPMIVISPYARAAYTDSRDATFTSVLAFIEHDFYLPALSSLDAHSYNFLGSFDFAQKPLGPVPLTTTKISSTEQQKIKANPPDPDDPT